MHRNLGDAYRHLARNREAAREYRAARVQTEEEVTLNPRSAEARARLALLCARLGEMQRASFELSQVLATAGADATVTANAVQTFEILNEREKALELLNRASRPLLEGLDRMPDLAGLRQDPRFRQLLQRP
jgi:tetratricopeptide (TPR) repeat protein